MRSIADIPPPPPPRPVEWRRGLTALRELLAEPERTDKAFEVFQFLDGDGEERSFQRLLASPDGPRLAVARPLLLARLADREALARLPEGSFGRAYLDHVVRTGLDSLELLNLKRELVERGKLEGVDIPDLDPAREWFRDRTILMHDLWHVLTGYGTDEIGEGALLYFSHAQVRGRANTIFICGIAVRTIQAGELGLLPYLVEAWRRGNRARWLMGLPYEELLPQPLEEVRRAAGILPALVAHRGGLRVGSFSRAGGRARAGKARQPACRQASSAPSPTLVSSRSSRRASRRGSASTEAGSKSSCSEASCSMTMAPSVRVGPTRRTTASGLRRRIPS
jgi:ubiquinone biosynthesis protein COQ4